MKLFIDHDVMECLIRDVFCSSWVLVTIKDGVWDGPQPVAIKTSGDKVVTSKRCVTGVTLHNKPTNLLYLTSTILLSHLLRLAPFFGRGTRIDESFCSAVCLDLKTTNFKTPTRSSNRIDSNIFNVHNAPVT